MKKIVVGILRAYKPFDNKLRRFSPYAKISRALQKRYHIFKSGLDLQYRSRDVARIVYVDNYCKILPRDNVILFECYWGKRFGGNPLAIYRELVKSTPKGKFKIYWVVGDVVPPVEISKNSDVVIVKPGSKEYGIALVE